MTDLTKASEALSRRKLVHTTYCYVASQGKPHESCTCGLPFFDAVAMAPPDGRGYPEATAWWLDEETA